MSNQLPPQPIVTDHTAEQPAATGRRFQFSLGTLLLGMSALSVLFAGMSAVGAVWSIVIGWCVVLILAHIAGNAWGTRVRGQVPIPHPDDLPPILPQAAPVEAYAPASRLRENVSPGGAMIALTCLGAAVGGAIGSGLLWKPVPPLTFYPGYIVGVASASIVGGFLGYLTGSFLETSLSAWREAAGDGSSSLSSRRKKNPSSAR